VRINADAVGQAYEGLKPKVTPLAGVDLQTEFLCFLGRDAASLH